jgi:hypothetical protein
VEKPLSHQQIPATTKINPISAANCPSIVVPLHVEGGTPADGRQFSTSMHKCRTRAKNNRFVREAGFSEGFFRLIAHFDSLSPIC